MLAGPVFIATIIVIVGGALKLGSPGATQGALRALSLPDHRGVVYLMGLVEVGAGATMAAFGGPVPAAILATAYLAFAGFVFAAQHHSDGLASCGCFGSVDTPPSSIHLIVNLVSAGVLAASVAWPVDDIGTVLAAQPWLGVPFLGLLALGSWLVYVAITVLPRTLAPDRSVAVSAFSLRGVRT